MLRSERDQNFRIETDDASRFIFKVANVDQSSDVIDFQLGALQHIARVAPALPVPRVVPSDHGLDFHTVQFSNGCDHDICLLTYLDGALLSDTGVRDDGKTRREIGRLLANVDVALRAYFHPAADQQHPWNFEACTRLRHLTKHIRNVEARAEVDEIFEHMSEIVIPRLQSLRHQVIHQDAHADNILVDPDDPARITGLIDFGDLLYGTLTAEIAVACDNIPYGSPDMALAAAEIVASFDSVLALEEEEVDLVFDLVCARNAMTATIAAARLALTPEQPVHIQSPLSFVDRLRELKRVGRASFTQQLRTACRFPVFCPKTTHESLSQDEEARLIDARRSLMGRNTTHFYERPMHFERARGPWLFSTDGRRYLDCYNNVPQVGHCHPHVVRAISRQAAALNTNTRYLYSSALEYADRLTSKLAAHLSACIFVNSGSEANDVAWQMAKLITGNTGAVIVEDAYHGVTDVIRQFSPGRPDTILPAFLKGLIVPDPYRGPFREGDPALLQKYAADADRAIAELEASGHGVAAFMIDSALCSSGVPDVPEGYMQAIEKKIRAAGGLMICDEVQSGFGRMGQWWGHEHHGVRADIVTMGKPVGNGHPLGVVVTTQEILNRFIDKTRLFSTFGGNTVACAAGNAVLDVIEQEDLIERSRTIGDYLRSEIAKLASKHALIGDVRGHGMVTGLEFVTDRGERLPATAATARLVELMRRERVLVGSEGRDANVLKLRPPLVFRRKHIDVFIEALDRSLDAL
ncbi:MAG: aminotransferase class III-fold pyridoxal phosphate-dependent enzyme [Gammaproteobacteria bacterium]|nr:aminotransferase class III-fold pyridoxal phosphate-dependent enzyme [Gammaproteobacteria bacterium]NND47628.1 aminotransferase class III-fold pyridoxal phosphate-dependent enzyme [Woeseiaceae bacterium]